MAGRGRGRRPSWEAPVCGQHNHAGPHGLHPETPLTQPPRLRSQLASVLCTNSPRQSTRAGTTAGWACRTQSTASPAATEYRDTTLPHVTPAGRAGGAAQQEAAETSAEPSPRAPRRGRASLSRTAAIGLAAEVRLEGLAPTHRCRGARPTSTSGQSRPHSQWFLGRHFLGLHYTPAHLARARDNPAQPICWGQPRDSKAVQRGGA